MIRFYFGFESQQQAPQKVSMPTLFGTFLVCVCVFMHMGVYIDVYRHTVIQLNGLRWFNAYEKTSSLVVDSGTFSVLRDDWKCWFSQLAMSPEGVAWWFLWQVLNILLTSPDWLGHLQQDDVTWTRIAGRYQEWFIWGIILLTCWTFMYGKSNKKQQLPFGDCNPSHLWQHWGRHGGYHINYCSVWEVLYCSPVTPVYKPPQNLGFVLDLFILAPKWDNYSWIIRMADEVGDGCRLVVSAHMGFPEMRVPPNHHVESPWVLMIPNCFRNAHMCHGQEWIQ